MAWRGRATEEATLLGWRGSKQENRRIL